MHITAESLKKLSDPDYELPKCEKCGSTERVLVDYDPMWQDGEIHCKDCGNFIRNYDAG